MIVLDAFPFAVSVAEAAERVRLDAADPENAEDLAALTRLVEAVNRVGRPKALLRELAAELVPPDGIDLAGKRFTGRIFRSLCLHEPRVWAVCITCGAELSALEADLDILERFWLDELRMLLLGAARRAVTEYLRPLCAGPNITSAAPGTGPIDLWPLPQIEGLFELMGGRQLSIGVTLTDSMLMLPEKSAAGIWFGSEHSYAGCLYCRRENCPQRRAPYDPEAEKRGSNGV